MTNWFKKIVQRLSAVQKISAAKGATYFFSENVKFVLQTGSSIEIHKGSLRVGFDLNSNFPHASRSSSVIALGVGAKLIIEDSVSIGPGCSIRVGDGATLRFKGQNQIDHDVSISCRKEIEIGYRTEMSWNVTLMDDDGHEWLQPDGQRKRGNRVPLRIGSNVGIFMHTIVINGAQIGENSIVGPNIVIRRSVPSNCMCYEEPLLKIRNGHQMLPIGESEERAKLS
jgi:acetyltransferase-like isoleucine patch superfamily enzyme